MKINDLIKVLSKIKDEHRNSEIINENYCSLFGIDFINPGETNKEIAILKFYKIPDKYEHIDFCDEL